MNTLYPLKFKPIFKDKIWGGNRIQTILGMDFSPLPNCGEVWVVSDYQGNHSVVENGFLAGNELSELIEVYMSDLVGDKVYEKFHNEFPLLIKFIDSNDYLSIQVHPDDELAQKKNIGSGKTEMWYILHAEKNAELISGFNQKMNRNTYLEHLKNKTLTDILNYENVSAGDAFYLPAGRVHALGPGILLTEIQQTSDNTFRIYDWDRVDAQGKSRELHTALALEAMDFNVYNNYRTDYLKVMNHSATLVKCPYFNTSLLHFSQAISKDYSELDSFVIFICVQGSCEIFYDQGIVDMRLGDAVLIPAEIKNVILQTTKEAKLLEVYIL